MSLKLWLLKVAEMVSRKTLLGSRLRFASRDLVWLMFDCQISASLRGCVKYKYIICMAVSKSFGVVLAVMPSVISLIYGDTFTFFPANFLSSCAWVKSAMPLLPIISAARFAEVKSWSLAKEVPPNLYPLIRIWSFLNSVGLSITLMPLLSVTVVIAILLSL